MVKQSLDAEVIQERRLFEPVASYFPTGSSVQIPA
jgi:hypothetical protein